MIAVDRLQDAWAWLNDGSQLERADQAVDDMAADLLPLERARVAVVHIAFAVVACFVLVGALVLITMLAMWPALYFQQPLLVIPGALPAPVVWAGLWRARRVSMAWVLRSITARAVSRAAAVLDPVAVDGSPVAVPVDVDVDIDVHGDVDRR